MPENKHLRRALYFAYGAVGVLAVWFLLRFALPWLLPFIVGFVIAQLMEPAVRFLTAHFHFRRSYAAGLCTVVIFAALTGLTALIIGRAVIELTGLVKNMPSILMSLSKTIGLISDRLNAAIGSAPPEIQNYLKNALDGFGDKTAELPATLSGKILGLLTDAARFTPKLVLFFLTCAVSVFFISSSWHEVRLFVFRQIPRSRHKTLGDIKNDLFETFGKWIKAELMLSGITFLEMAVAFLVLRIEPAILLALLVAVVDALPVLGSGTVLVPWALVLLLGGNYQTAVTLIVLFGVNALFRNILEPKLIGKQIGLPPIATLIAIYVGFCTVGVIGMVLFPIGLIMIKHLNDKGYIRLWKS
ncbi:sporulation integral membrane protein YtvI [Oscillospiraceae bacterium CM]|nr:sporulation integral membrane protein YtvI [Oscillospiraceae bacterium CM]